MGIEGDGGHSFLTSDFRGAFNISSIEMIFALHVFEGT